MIKDFLQDQAALHALGLLEAEEARAFEQAMAGDLELKRLVDDHRETMADLTRALPVETPSAELKSKVMQATTGKPKAVGGAGKPMRESKGGGAWIGAMGWGLAAAFAVTSAWLWNQAETLEAQRRGIAMAEADARAAAMASSARLATMQKVFEAGRALAVERATSAEGKLNEMRVELSETVGKLATVEQQVESLQKKDALAQMQIATLASTVKEYQQGVAVVVWDSERHQGILELEKMPPLATDKDYQLWVVDPKQKNPVDAGIVTVNADGFAKVDFKPLSDVSEAAKFAVSVERKGGVPVAEGPIVFVGP